MKIVNNPTPTVKNATKDLKKKPVKEMKMKSGNTLKSVKCVWKIA